MNLFKSGVIVTRQTLLLYFAGEYDPITGAKIKKKKATRPGDEGPDQYEYVSHS